MNRTISAMVDVFVITLVSLWSAGLQAPIEPPTSPNSVLMPNNESYYNSTPETSCPGYEQGSPSRRNMTGCETGTSLDPVDHETAFRFNHGENPDWNSCDLPHLPEENEKICYRTTVDKCGNNYRIYLNRRNLTSLQKNCPHESKSLQTTNANGTDRIFQSPRYGCRKGNGSGNLYNYRRSDLCLYNISIPNCESGILIIESASDSDQKLEGKLKDGNGQITCSDYLQFYYGNLRTDRFCANELSLLLPLQIPATQLMAIFWTDPAINKLGFKLRARCANSD